MSEELLKSVNEILHYDPETGIFTWKKKSAKKVIVGSTAGNIGTDQSGKSYLRIMVAGKTYRAHRLAWLITHGEFPPDQIDHINGNGLDNRLINLRAVTISDNQKNLRLKSSNSSGVCGVSFDNQKRKWRAYIKFGGKQKYLGYFSEFDLAVAARKEAGVIYGFHPNHGSIRPL